MATPFTTGMLDMYAHYKNGILPFPGGILNQPQVYAEAMTIIHINIDR